VSHTPTTLQGPSSHLANSIAYNRLSSSYAGAAVSNLLMNSCKSVSDSTCLDQEHISLRHPRYVHLCLPPSFRFFSWLYHPVISIVPVVYVFLPLFVLADLYVLLLLFCLLFTFPFYLIPFWPTDRSGLCHRKSVCLSVCNVGVLWPNGLSDRHDFWHTPCPGQQ